MFGIQDSTSRSNSSVPGPKKEILCGLPALSYNETGQPIIRYINEHLDSAKVRLIACISLEDYEDKVRKGVFDLTIINGVQMELAERSGYRVIGRVADEYQSVIFVNKDSAIRNLADLGGHSISLTGNKMLAGAIMPLVYLYRHGVDVRHSVKCRYAPSYESVLMDVCLGKSSAGAVWGIAFKNFTRLQPELASHLQVKWITPSLPSNALMIRRDMDKGLVARLTGLFFHLQDDSAGRHALALSGVSKFEPTDGSSYAPMKQFVKEYDSLIH